MYWLSREQKLPETWRDGLVCLSASHLTVLWHSSEDSLMQGNSSFMNNSAIDRLAADVPVHNSLFDLLSPIKQLTAYKQWIPRQLNIGTWQRMNELSVCCDAAERVQVPEQWSSHRRTCRRRRRHSGRDAAWVALRAALDRPATRILSSRCSNHTRHCSGSSLCVAVARSVISSCTLSPLRCRRSLLVVVVVVFDADDAVVTCPCHFVVVSQSCSRCRCSLS